MPLVVLNGTVVAIPILADLDLVGAALVATMLAPTDATLGEPVVADARVPVRIREALNIESRLNDGLGLPLLLFFMLDMGRFGPRGPASLDVAMVEAPHG